MISEEAWAAVKHEFPVGREVRGRIAVVRPFGMFVELQGRPDVIALVDAISYYPDRDPIPQDQWPAVGEEIEAVVSDHAEHNRQIKLRVE